MKKGARRSKVKSLDSATLPELPASWSWAKLVDLAADEPNAITDGPFGSKLKTAHYTSIGPRVIRLQNIGNGQFVDEYAHISEAHFHELSKHHIHDGDLVIAALGETLPRSCIVPSWVGPALVKADCPRFKPNQDVVAPPFINFALNSPGLRHRTSSTIHGVGRPRLNLAEIRGLWIPIPPLAEQHRIVSKIEELFSDLDAGVAALERAEANLKRYRASVLKAAVEGRLTEAWRADHPDIEPASDLLTRILTERRERWEQDQLAKYEAKGKKPPKGWQKKYKEPAGPDVEGLPELPEGWCWATVEQVSRFVRYGSSKKTSVDSEGVPVLRMGNIIDGELSLLDLKYLPEDHNEFPELLLEPNDLLFNRTNSVELVGKSAIYAGVPEKCSYASYLIAVRMFDGCQSAVICNALNSAYGRRWVRTVVSQQVGQANVNGTKLKSFAFPLPPEAEQPMILEKVDALLSSIGRSMVEVQLAYQRSSRLRQSILKRAFAGELVPQDPADEPASELLKRIQVEREAAEKKRKPTRKKRAKKKSQTATEN